MLAVAAPISTAHSAATFLARSLLIPSMSFSGLVSLPRLYFTRVSQESNMSCIPLVPLAASAQLSAALVMRCQKVLKFAFTSSDSVPNNPPDVASLNMPLSTPQKSAPPAAARLAASSAPISEAVLNASPVVSAAACAFLAASAASCAARAASSARVSSDFSGSARSDCFANCSTTASVTSVDTLSGVIALEAAKSEFLIPPAKPSAAAFLTTCSKRPLVIACWIAAVI